MTKPAKPKPTPKAKKPTPATAKPSEPTRRRLRMPKFLLPTVALIKRLWSKLPLSSISFRPQRAAKAQSGANRWATLVRDITQSSWLVVLLAVVASLVIGGILVVLADKDVRDASAYLFSRPGDTFSAIGDALSSAYSTMFKGSIYNYSADSFGRQISPFIQTLTEATPLIFAGLGLGVGFRAGLFNIGAFGQILMGALIGGYVGFAWHLPVVLHLLVAIIGCMIGGALFGAIPGILKARTGAHEVITTIMLNFVAVNLVAFALSKDAFQRPESNNPQSPIVDPNAQYPLLLGKSYDLDLAFVAALAAAVGVWWLMERSTYGFAFRAAGANPNAARTAGISVPKSYIMVFLIAGALAGLAGSSQVLDGERSFSSGIAATFGFDAITVALLGRSRPGGIVLAAILFGGLRASGPALQAQAGIPTDIVLVVQSLIVLFIAAPPLVRSMFRLPAMVDEKVVAA